MKNITISVDDDLWSKIRDAAASERKSMNAFIRDALSSTLPGHQMTAGERAAAVACELGPAPKSWKWNREEIYREMFSEKSSNIR
jgi:plasmid stability protein